MQLIKDNCHVNNVKYKTQSIALLDCVLWSDLRGSQNIVPNAFKTQAGIRTLRWPARSPDLNPIENVWSLLKRGVRRSIRPGDDLSRLEALLRQEWERLSQAVINRLIESMSSRIRQVIELSGDVTKY